MEIENLKNTIIERDVEHELIWITVSKYALFMSYGRTGIDAKSLYEHYQFTSILQKTNSVKALDTYCRQGLDWGRERFEKAKNLLIDLGLITIKQTRGERGHFGTTYVKVHTKRVELEPIDIHRLSENRQADLTASGKTTTNALTNNINALTNNLNPIEDPENTGSLYDSSIFLEKWNTYPLLTKHKSAKAEVYQKAHRYCQWLMNGSLGKHCDLDRQWLEQNQVPVELPRKKFTQEEIFQGIERLNRIQQEGYFPSDKKGVHKSFHILIFNSCTRSSWFLKVMATDPRPLNETAMQCVNRNNPEITELYEKLLKKEIRTVRDEFVLVQKVNTILDWYEKLVPQIQKVSFLDGGCKSHFGTLEKFVDKHIRWLSNFKDLQIGTLTRTWKLFLRHIRKEYNYNFDPTSDEMRKMDEAYKQEKERWSAMKKGIHTENKPDLAHI